MTKQRSSRELLQASTVVVCVVFACASLTLASHENRQCLKEPHAQKWLDTGKHMDVTKSVSGSCIRMEKHSDNIIEFKQDSETQKCIITCKSKTDEMEVKFIDTSSQKEMVDFYEETYYLPYKPNTATYMHLNWHVTPGHLFITDKLGGCDIWIADSVNLGKSTGPLIVHVNAQKHDIYKEPGQNLAYKETLAKTALANFNTNLNKDAKYKFYCRISYDMIEAIDHEIKEKTRKEKLRNVSKMKSKVKDYWKNADSEYYYTSLYWFEKHGLFYGYYDVCSTTDGEWQFKLKDLKSGKLKKVEYKSNQSCKLEEIIYHDTEFSTTCSKSLFQKYKPL